MRADPQHNQLRIIAGSWGGRKLCFAPVPGLRPTPNRVRETLFNWLQPVIQGARCLDLYAGSGALGVEAASRGAAVVVLVDRDPQVVRTLRKQLQLLAADQVQVIQADVGNWLSDNPEMFDIVFLDPPFREGQLPAAIRQLEAGGWLAPEAWIYVEAEQGLVPELPDNWELYRSKRAGQVGYHLARRRAAGPAVQDAE
jgi:16S rRNA (guanine966-N2)-methyltransferase